MAQKPHIEPDDLPIDFNYNEEEDLKTLKDTLEKTEKQLLIKALSIHGSTHRIAKALGVR